MCRLTLLGQLSQIGRSAGLDGKIKGVPMAAGLAAVEMAVLTSTASAPISMASTAFWVPSI